MTHIIAQHGRVRIVRGHWQALVQTLNAAGEEWLDYGDVSLVTEAQFEDDFSEARRHDLSRCMWAWVRSTDSECSEVAADALAARDDVLPS
jgi:uncharacterized tellurite resistance protein B-like protein